MREIRGWNVGQVVTSAQMRLNTANLSDEIGSNGKANLPCIYNGLSLQSQSGTGGSIVTFEDGVCRCRDLPTSIYTYLPANAYSDSWPCPIDISALDANRVITLSTGITAGYIVATFTLAPTSPGSVDYVITGELQQIATASYDPAIHVRLCSFTYSAPNFTLNFTPGTSRDTDLTGAGGVQWDYQNSQLVIKTPESQAGTNPVYFPNKITPSSFVAPTQQKFTTPGAGTYTAPALRPLYIRVQLCGAGAGGSGSLEGAGSKNPGTDGGDSSFSTFLDAFGGHGWGNLSSPGAGGGYNISAGIGFGFDGEDGADGVSFENSPDSTVVTLCGGDGGASLFNGVGRGGGDSRNNGTNAVNNTGCGGGGGGAFGNTTGILTGEGGGGGGYVDVIIPNPNSSYSFILGSKGIGGAAAGGSNAHAGGNGADPILIVTEYYS